VTLASRVKRERWEKEDLEEQEGWLGLQAWREREEGQEEMGRGV
jgi:hypothetical protein